LTPFRQRPGHNRHGRGRKGKFEKPKGLIYRDGAVPVEKVRGTHKGNIGSLVLSTKGQGVTNYVKPESGTAGIEKILEHGVLDVLFPHTPRTQHGEAGLH
jgi:hypothetical protein